MSFILWCPCFQVDITLCPCPSQAYCLEVMVATSRNRFLPVMLGYRYFVCREFYRPSSPYMLQSSYISYYFISGCKKPKNQTTPPPQPTIDKLLTSSFYPQLQQVTVSVWRASRLVLEDGRGKIRFIVWLEKIRYTLKSVNTAFYFLPTSSPHCTFFLCWKRWQKHLYFLL